MAAFPTMPSPHSVPRPRYEGGRLASPHVPAASGLAFALFLLVNAALFIRPGEVLEAVRGVEIYQYIILLCLVVSLPSLLALLSPRVLEKRPIALCILGLCILVPLSNLTQGNLGEAFTTGLDFVKLFLYYLLFLAVVTTPARLRVLLICLTLFSLVAATLAILDYHEVIQLYKTPQLDAQGNEITEVISDGEKRMVGTGIFQDPNDLCTLLAMAVVLVLYQISDRRWSIVRFAWLLPLAVFLYGIRLTSSRGGLLATLSGIGTLLLLRYGWQRTALMGLMGVPVLLAGLAGRQADISVGTTTGQARLELWSAGLDMFRSSPLFGVGVGRYTDYISHVAHNSYLHTFAEMGFLGGGLFAGSYYLAIWGLVRLSQPVTVRGRSSPRVPVILDPELRHLYPYLTGAVVAWAVGMLSLTLCYVVPTYTVLGLASVYLLLTATNPPLPPLRFDGTLAVRMALFGVVYLAGIYLFVRFFRQW